MKKLPFSPAYGTEKKINKASFKEITVEDQMRETFMTHTNSEFDPETMSPRIPKMTNKRSRTEDKEVL